MRKRWILPVTVVVLALVLGQCGGGEEETASTTPPEKPKAEMPELKVTQDNPCSVMFPNEIGDILGAPSSLREIMDEVTCRYHFEPPAGSPPKSEDGETFIETKVHWSGGKGVVAAQTGAEKLDGVGDEAWWDPASSHLVFSKGDAAGEISMRMMPDKEKAIRIAQLMASRM